MNIIIVSRLGLVVRRSAGKRKDAGSTPRFGLTFRFKKCDFWTLSLTLPCIINETSKCLTSLPILMRNSFW